MNIQEALWVKEDLLHKYVEYAQHNCVKLYRESMRCLQYHLNISWITKILLLLHNKAHKCGNIKTRRKMSREERSDAHTSKMCVYVCKETMACDNEKQDRSKISVPSYKYLNPWFKIMIHCIELLSSKDLPIGPIFY